MEDTKLVKQITDWNPKGVRTKGRQSDKWFKEAKTENMEPNSQRQKIL